MKYEKLGKRALTCMYVKTAIWFLVAVVTVFIVNGLFKEEWPAIISYILYGFIAVNFLYLLVAPKVRYERYRYCLTEEGIEVKKGLLVITTQIVPIERLHKIEVTSGPIFRAFHLEEVLVTTAGGDLSVSYLDSTVAERISAYLRKRINTIAAEERNYANAGQKDDENLSPKKPQAESEGADGEA
ncbi:MAG: PH domain-containing protein [Lachnospiraceae bacterium]|nr:PH domain-containing protein [Lachnospiraceae bacterium]